MPTQIQETVKATPVCSVCGLTWKVETVGGKVVCVWCGSEVKGA